MANFINKYLNNSAYVADDTKQYPNVSLVDGTLVYEAEEPQEQCTTTETELQFQQNVADWTDLTAAGAGGDFHIIASSASDLFGELVYNDVKTMFIDIKEEILSIGDFYLDCSETTTQLTVTITGDYEGDATVQIGNKLTLAFSDSNETIAVTTSGFSRMDFTVTSNEPVEE